MNNVVYDGEISRMLKNNIREASGSAEAFSLRPLLVSVHCCDHILLLMLMLECL